MRASHVQNSGVGAESYTQKERFILRGSSVLILSPSRSYPLIYLFAPLCAHGLWEYNWSYTIQKSFIREARKKAPFWLTMRQPRWPWRKMSITFYGWAPCSCFSWEVYQIFSMFNLIQETTFFTGLTLFGNIWELSEIIAFPPLDSSSPHFLQSFYMTCCKYWQLCCWKE